MLSLNQTKALASGFGILVTMSTKWMIFEAIKANPNKIRSSEQFDWSSWNKIKYQKRLLENSMLNPWISNQIYCKQDSVFHFLLWQYIYLVNVQWAFPGFQAHQCEQELKYKDIKPERNILKLCFAAYWKLKEVL